MISQTTDWVINYSFTRENVNYCLECKPHKTESLFKIIGFSKKDGRKLNPVNQKIVF